MKTFNDLIFKKDSIHLPSNATLTFDNGYGISVITGKGAYCNADFPYEAAVLFEGNITYDTYITSDVIGYLTSENISKLMILIQEL